jgi:transcriptional regulator
MYLPPQFKSDDPALAASVMRAHPFASLVSIDDSGLPFVTHLPLHVEQQGAAFTLWGHVAKPNPHWRLLRERPRALVTFLGAHAYQSPAIYPDKQRVPSWNYLAVHCEVQVRLVEDEAAKDALLKKLIGDHEPPYAEQWRSLGEEFAHKMLAGIVGLEFAVTRWECKLKINQHRPESHARMHDTYAAGNEHERELAQWMARLGMVKELG